MGDQREMGAGTPLLVAAGITVVAAVAMTANDGDIAASAGSVRASRSSSDCNSAGVSSSPASAASSSTGFSAISFMIMSFSSKRLHWSIVTI